MNAVRVVILGLICPILAVGSAACACMAMSFQPAAKATPACCAHRSTPSKPHDCPHCNGTGNPMLTASYDSTSATMIGQFIPTFDRVVIVVDLQPRSTPIAGNVAPSPPPIDRLHRQCALLI